MARCILRLLPSHADDSACARTAPFISGAAVVGTRRPETGQERRPIYRAKFLLCSTVFLLFATVWLVQWQQVLLFAEGGRRGAGGGGVAGGRGRAGSSDRATRGHAYPLLQYLLGFSVPLSVALTYALLVGAAVAAFFFLRRPSRTTIGGGGGAAGAALRKDDTRRVFRPCASICLNDILLKRDVGGKLYVEESAVQPFLSLCGWSKLYVFVQVKGDEEEHVMNALERIQAFDHGLLRHRVMFCSTVEGRASMVRQLQPLTHVDADSFIGATLEGKVPNVVCLREPLKECVDVLQAALRRH